MNEDLIRYCITFFTQIFIDHLKYDRLILCVGEIAIEIFLCHIHPLCKYNLKIKSNGLSNIEKLEMKWRINIIN